MQKAIDFWRDVRDSDKDYGNRSMATYYVDAWRSAQESYEMVMDVLYDETESGYNEPGDDDKEKEI